MLHAKGVAFRFQDVESDIYSAAHLLRHPFGRVPVLEHGDFWLYETSAIALYVDECFSGPRLLPTDPSARAKCHQWMSSLNAYFYPYMVYYLVHERVVFPDLGIAADEAVVAESLPKIERALIVLNRALPDRPYLVGDAPTLADYFMLPTLTALGFAPEGHELLGRFPAVTAWLTRMGKLPEIVAFRATLPARGPIAHARRWATEHRPGVRGCPADGA